MAVYSVMARVESYIKSDILQCALGTPSSFFFSFPPPLSLTHAHISKIVARERKSEKESMAENHVHDGISRSLSP